MGDGHHGSERPGEGGHGADFVRGVRPIGLQLLAGRGHYEVVVQAVLGAERSIWIATANLKELMVEDLRARPGRRRTMGPRRGAGTYRSILALFSEKVLAGVDIRILHAAPPSRPFREELRRQPDLRAAAAQPGSSGVPAPRGRFEMRACPRVHFKAVIVDGGFVYLGSANWTGAGLGAKGENRRNFELGFAGGDDVLLDDVQGYFEGIWRGRPCGACRLRGECPHPLDTIAAAGPRKTVAPGPRLRAGRLAVVVGLPGGAAVADATGVTGGSRRRRPG